MANPIVTVNVTQTIAPETNRLQKRGALISQGGTTLSAGTYTFLSQYSDLATHLSAALALTSVTWASSYGGQVTATTSVAHGIPVNTQFVTTIAGVSPDGYNGTVMATATGASTFTYYLTTNPGAQVTAGTYTPQNVGELQAMARTFFTQGAQQGVYVLELGAVSTTTAVGVLQDFIDDSPQFFYSYLVPRNWSASSTFLTFLAAFESTTAKTYFFVTANLQDYTRYTALMKDVILLVEAPQYAAWASTDIDSVSVSSTTITATMDANHGIAPGQTFTMTGALPTTYNGTFIALPGSTGTSLVYQVVSAPGSYVSGGTVTASRYTSAGVPATEFTHAADFWVTLNYSPSTTNRVTPFAFSYLYGVTAFPTMGNSALIATLNTANVNYVGYGAEGGISNTILFNGHTMDGRPFNYWYSVDWMQINVDISVANAIVNGSNNPINPLYYNQDGINRLEQVVASVGGNAVTYGLALGRVLQVGLDGTSFQQNLDAGIYNGNVVVNAVPFISYTAENPSDYRVGAYNGLSLIYTPLRGFESIIFNINVTDFVAAGA